MAKQAKVPSFANTVSPRDAKDCLLARIEPLFLNMFGSRV